MYKYLTLGKNIFIDFADRNYKSNLSKCIEGSEVCRPFSVHQFYILEVVSTVNIRGISEVDLRENWGNTVTFTSSDGCFKYGCLKKMNINGCYSIIHSSIVLC